MPKKSRYDQFGHAGVDGQGGGFHAGGGFADFGDFGDLFNSIFEEFGGSSGRSRRRSSARMGADLEMGLWVTFEEAAFGAKRVVDLKKMTPCQTCEGTGAKPERRRKVASIVGEGASFAANRVFSPWRRLAPSAEGKGR